MEMQDKIARYQEIERRGLLNQLPAEKQAAWAEIKRRGLDGEQPQAQESTTKPSDFSATDHLKYGARNLMEMPLFGAENVVAGGTNVLANDLADITHGKDLATRAKGYGKYLMHTLMPGNVLQNEDFKQGRKDYLEEKEAYHEAHPQISNAEELLGGLAGGWAGAGKKVVSSLAKPTLLNMAKAGAKTGFKEGGKFGLAYGGVSGATSDPDKLSVENGLIGAGTGALGGSVIGGGLGFALPYGIAGTVGAWNFGKRAIGKATDTFKNKSINTLLGANKELVEQSIKEGKPLIDIADQKVMDVAEGANLLNREAKQTFADYGRQRIEGQHPKVINEMQQYFGNKGSHQLLDELNADVQKGAKTLYDKAVYQVDNAGNVLLDNAGRPVGKVLPELEALNKYELDYVGKVYGTKGLEYEVGGLPQNDMRVLNYAKQLMDDDIQRLTNQGHNNQARILSEKRAAFVEKIDKANPEYKAARNFFERGKRAEEALQAGKNAIGGERSNMEYDFNNLTPEEKAFYVKGVGNRLEELSNQQASGGNIAHKIFGEETLRRLKALGIKDVDKLENFARAEMKAASNINSLRGGSPTADRLEAIKRFALGMIRKPGRTVTNVLANTAFKPFYANPAEIAKAMTDPQYLAQLYAKSGKGNINKSVMQVLNQMGTKAGGTAAAEPSAKISDVLNAAKKTVKNEGGFAVNPLAEQGQSVKQVLNSLGEPAEKLLKPRNLVAENFVSDVNNVLKDSSVNNFQKIEMGQIPWVYIANGLEEQPLRTNKLAIRKAMGLLTPEELKAHPEWHNHNVPKDVIDKMPELIADPLAIFKSNTEKGKYVAVLDAKVKGDPVVAIISPGEKGGYTFMPTSYERKSFDEFVKNTQKANNVVYVDTKRSSTPHTLIQAVSVGNDDPTYSIATKEGIVKGYFDNLKKFSNKSKIVDENGKPLVMYHGTPNATYEEFNPLTHFTSNREYAAHYRDNQGASSMGYKPEANRPDIYEVYLDMKKPFDTRNKAARDIFKKEYQAYYSPELTEKGLVDWMEVEDLAEWLQKNHPEYDGIIADEGGVGGYGQEVIDRGLTYVPFKPHQIKSVFNKGTFNKKSKNIYKSIVGGLGISQILRNQEAK